MRGLPMYETTSVDVADFDSPERPEQLRGGMAVSWSQRRSAERRRAVAQRIHDELLAMGGIYRKLVERQFAQNPDALLPKATAHNGVVPAPQ